MGSVSRLQMDSSTLLIVRAGDHWSLRMSRQMPPALGQGKWEWVGGVFGWLPAWLRASPVDVGVVDLGGERDLGRLEGVLGGELDVQEEHPALVRRVIGSQDGGLPAWAAAQNGK